MVKKTTEELLNVTRGAAMALVEDLPHIREVVNRPDPDKGELRRLSNELRRLLIDNGGDLRDVAAPRIGRFKLLSFDNNPVFKAERKEPFAFYQSGGAAVYGVHMRAATLVKGPKVRALENFDPDRTLPLDLDNFLSQKVLCLNGKWASRRECIKYIANIASGVHSGQPKDTEHLLLNRIRHVAAYEIGNHGANVVGAKLRFNTDAFSDSEMEFAYSANSVDPVLIELLASARLLTMSPDIEKLESSIKNELGLS
jgi:hypothetical protein